MQPEIGNYYLLVSMSFFSDVKKRYNFNNKDSGPPEKKSKIESLETNKNNHINSVIVEVLEKIKQTIENEIFDQIIPETMSDICIIPIPEIPIKTVVAKVTKPVKTMSSSVKTASDLKETKLCENGKSTKALQPKLSENPCKSQSVIDDSPWKLKSSFKQKPKVSKNEPKFKEKNALFKYGNYNR